MIRHLKVFISSTFQDMQKEREILLKETFLELKKIAKSRDVEVTEIDLRTGITKEQEQNGEIVKLCLDEIDRCSDSPIFFLGMLGNRYGWKEWHEYTNLETLEDNRYSWIKEYIGKSVTELEIISAIERDKKHNKAFIYLKDGIDDDMELTELKNRLIEKSKSNNNLSITHYKDSIDFREKTINSFTKALDELYPKDEKISEVEKLRSYHKIFAQSRQKIYISHKKNESILDNFIESSQDKLLLYGESGLGKSALIANYFKRFKKRNNMFIIEHYIGGAGELSNDLHQMLRRIMLEIKEKFKLDDEIPSEPQKIMDKFAFWLSSVKQPTIIILDGYNQIEDELKEKLFYYIPEKLEHVKFIVTSIKNSYPIKNSHQIEPLTQEEQRILVVDYLKDYGKTIEEAILYKIIEHPQTTNTLFLRTLLNEIRLLGNFERLQEDIDNYLTAKDVVELFIKIFERLKIDYRENLAKEVLSLLYVSRDGLSEDNLMEIINQNTTKKLTRLEFSPLFLAIEEHLINKGGLYGFFHDFIRLAVKNRYLSCKELVNEERKKIADYFEGRDIDNQRVRELPFQLFELEDRDKLYDILIDIDFFVKIHDKDEYELLKYIRLIDEINDFSKQFYKIVINQVKLDLDKISKIAIFFKNYSKYIQSILLYKKILHIKEQKQEKNHINIATTYHELAEVFRYMGEYKKALSLYQKALLIRKKNYIEKHQDIATSYNDLGLLYKSIGEYNKALSFYKKASNIWKSIFGEYHPDIATNYNNIAVLYKKLGLYSEALPFYEKSLKLRKAIFTKNHPDISQSYNNLGGFYLDLNQYKKALEYYKKALYIREKILGYNHSSTATVYNNMAVTYLKMNEYKRALPFLKKDLKVSQNLLGRNHPDLATSYHSFGNFNKKIRKYQKALIYYKKDLKISMKILGTQHIDLATTYNSLAETYKLIKKVRKSKFFYIKALKIRKKYLTKNHPDLKTTENELYLIQKKEYNKNFIALKNPYLIHLPRYTRTQRGVEVSEIVINRNNKLNKK